MLCSRSLCFSQARLNVLWGYAASIIIYTNDLHLKMDVSHKNKEKKVDTIGLDCGKLEQTRNPLIETELGSPKV